MRFDDVYGRYRSGVLGCEAAADLLGVSLSSFYRWRERYEAEGASGLADARLGRVSKRRVPVDEVTRVIELFATRYFDFTAKHFHEKLVAEHGIRRSYMWTKLVLQGAGCIRKAPTKEAHRRKRVRRPLVGMMLHQDGSCHDWVAGVGWDLIVTMDDADKRIYSAFFCDEEGTMSSFRGLSEVVAEHGLFGSLYTDRGLHYWTTIRAGLPDAGKVDKVNLTEVGRALA
jgi:transposase